MRIASRLWTIVAFCVPLAAQSAPETVRFHPGYRVNFGLEFDSVLGEVLVQLRGTCLDLSNGLCVRLQP